MEYNSKELKLNQLFPPHLKKKAQDVGWNMFNVAKRLMPSYNKVHYLMPIQASSVQN